VGTAGVAGPYGSSLICGKEAKLKSLEFRLVDVVSRSMAVDDGDEDEDDELDEYEDGADESEGKRGKFNSCLMAIDGEGVHGNTGSAVTAVTAFSVFIFAFPDSVLSLLLSASSACCPPLC